MITVLEETMKVCNKCGNPKLRNEFHKCKHNKDGLHVWCKNCRVKYQQQYQQTHKIEIIECDKEYRQTHKVEFAKYQREHRRSLIGYLRCRFQSMKQRCGNPKAAEYKNYGGRGIKCLFKSSDELIDCVINILGYDTIEKLEGLQIDRIDNDGHYEPENIRFVIPKVNINNRRK